MRGGRGRERIVIEGVCVNSIEKQLSNVAIDNTNIGRPKKDLFRFPWPKKK